MSGEVDWTVNRTQLNMVVWEETGEERRGEGSLALTFGTILILTSHYSLPGGGGGIKN